METGVTVRNIIIDTDAGVDDAQAILLALSNKSVNVLGITTVHGNTSVEQVCKNVLRVLQVADKLKIPVYKGCNLGLIGKTCDSSFYHGLDGLGDVPDPNAPGVDLIQQDHATSALVKLVKEKKGQISLVCLGPLTNVAMAVRLDPDFGKNLKDCYIMGGNYEGKGNISASAEFNFLCDPEAAHVVLNELGCPITMACWELCMNYALSWDFYHKLRGMKSVTNDFLSKIEAAKVKRKSKDKTSTFLSCDELAVAACICDRFITEKRDVYARVELHGELTRGQVVIDWRNFSNKSPNIILIQAIDTDLLKELFINMCKTC